METGLERMFGNIKGEESIKKQGQGNPEVCLGMYATGLTEGDPRKYMLAIGYFLANIIQAILNNTTLNLSNENYDKRLKEIIKLYADIAQELVGDKLREVATPFVWETQNPHACGECKEYGRCHPVSARFIGDLQKNISQ